MTQTLFISEAREKFAKRGGKPIHINTIRRWIGAGIMVAGQPVRLRAWREGVRYVTTEEWINEFKQEVSNRTEPARVTACLSGHAAAARFLMAEGLYEAPREVSDQKVPESRRQVRTVQAVLPDDATQRAQRSSDRTGVNQRQDAEATSIGATE